MSALWMVEAEECGDSGGGMITLFIFTKDQHTLPDPNESHRKYRGKSDCSLFRIDSVKLLEVNSELILFDSGVGVGECW